MVLFLGGSMTNLKIHIANRRNTKEGEYVGRPSPLGNPWRAGADLTRDEAIARYKVWLNIQWKTQNHKVRDELNRLANKLIEDGELTLVCWCAPKNCHADVIAEAIQAIVNKL
jgi:hypothetical protein